MKITEITPSVEPVYSVELTHTELKHICIVLGDQNGHDDDRLGVDTHLGSNLWDAACRALERVR